MAHGLTPFIDTTMAMTKIEHNVFCVNDVTYNEDMRKLVDQLRSKRPLWKFLLGRPVHRCATVFVASGEALGTIEWYGGLWQLTSSRTAKSMSYKHYRETSSIDRARQIVLKDFGAISTAERVTEFREAGLSGIIHRIATAQNKTGEKRYSFEPVLKSHGPESPEVKEHLANWYAAMEHARQVEKELDEDNLFMVFPWGEDTYVVRRPHRKETRLCTYTLDTMPDSLKTGMALLKMVSEDEYVQGVGFRTFEDDGGCYLITHSEKLAWEPKE